MMERKIGEVFECGDVKLEVVKVEITDRCADCYFRKSILCIRPESVTGSCYTHRSDGNSVIFREVVENVKGEQQASQKNDRKDGKLMWELLPLTDLEDVVKVYTFGAEKYAPNSWRGLEDGFKRYRAALLRHMVSFENGEEFDKESGLPALAHMAWNAIAMLAIWHDEQRKKNKDNEDK